MRDLYPEYTENSRDPTERQTTPFKNEQSMRGDVSPKKTHKWPLSPTERCAEPLVMREVHPQTTRAPRRPDRDGWNRTTAGVGEDVGPSAPSARPLGRTAGRSSKRRSHHATRRVRRRASAHERRARASTRTLDVRVHDGVIYSRQKVETAPTTTRGRLSKCGAHGRTSFGPKVE